MYQALYKYTLLSTAKTASRVAALLCSRRSRSSQSRLIHSTTLNRLFVPVIDHTPRPRHVRFVGGCTNECCKIKPPRCWKCNAVQINGQAEFFCRECEIIQPPGEDVTYYEILNSPEVFAVETTLLHNNYRELQFRLHPDRFSRCTQEEHELSVLHSSIVNKAYNTLLKPLSRGIYLLKLHGISIEENDFISKSEFLFEILEINEKLENASNYEDIQKIEQEIKIKLEQITSEVANAFDKDNFVAAKEALVQLRYYTNIESQVKNRKSSLI